MSLLVTIFLGLITTVATAGEPDPGGRLRHLASIPVPGAEVLAFDPTTRRCLVTTGSKVAAFSLDESLRHGPITTLDLAASSKRPGDATHVALDPRNRGFAAVCFAPADQAREPGCVVFFSTGDLDPIATLTVGFHPDCAKFTSDGARLVIANEGQPETGDSDPPGSVSIVDLRQVVEAEDLRGLRSTDVITIFPEATIDDLAAIRIHPERRTEIALDLEPEYIALAGNRAWVTLQENNAIGVIDLDAPRFVGVHGLGVVEQRIDGSDEDGGIHIDTVAAGFPMPDQLATFTAEGRRYLVTANEGDDRGTIGGDQPLADGARVSKLRKQGRLTQETADRLPGRLRVCAFSGDEDEDGHIDRPTTFGTRSVSVWDAETLRRVADTGSAFERLTAERMPDWFNANSIDGASEFDARSDDRGPEPEGICVTRVGGRTLGFVTLERPGAVAVIDLTETPKITVTELFPLALYGDFGPEGILFIPAADSPNRAPLLLVGCEVSGTVTVLAVD